MVNFSTGFSCSVHTNKVPKSISVVYQPQTGDGLYV